MKRVKFMKKKKRERAIGVKTTEKEESALFLRYICEQQPRKKHDRITSEVGLELF